MSAIGSVMVIVGTPPLPAGLGHAWQLAGVGELAHADAAQAELAQHGARPPAALAARVGPHLELRGALGLGDQRLLGHLAGVTSWPGRFAAPECSSAPDQSLRVSRGPEREAERAQQRPAVVV